MKPRTKLEHRVFDLSKERREISKSYEEWAFEICLDHKGFATKTRVICMDCGETFSPELIYRKRATCPHCETQLKIEYTKKRTDTQKEFFALTEVFQEFQIVRNFQLYGHYKKGEPVRIYVFEILQYWINDKSKVTMVGHNHNTQGYCDSWGGDWSIRKNRSSGYYYNGAKFKIYPYKFNPKSKFKKEYLKHGINHSLYGLNILDAIELVPKNQQAETLLKAKQYELLFMCRDYSNNINQYWSSIKICLRNNYKVKDASMWIDYLDLLRFFGKDLHNAMYVCPKNLKKAHDKLVDKKRIIKKREEIALKIKRAAVDQKIYLKEKGKFFGLKFSSGTIVIKVLESVQEFLEEGDVLKHCLFVNDYHKKVDSLILKAIVSGVTTETIEVSLKTFEVLQSRGLHNSPSKHHGEIVELMNLNLNKVRNKSRSQTKVKSLKQLEYAEAI